MDSESICARGSGVLPIFGGFTYERGGERACVMIQFKLSAEDVSVGF